MAIIETKTKESIIKNGYLLETLSRERIWDEIKKSFSQSKDFNEYLKYILDFKLSQYIFPGVEINTNLIDSKDLVVVFANLFLGNDTSKLETKLVQEFKIEGDVAKKIVFLLDFIKMSVEDVFDVFKKKVASGISDNTILDWLKVTGNETPMLIRFIHYKPSVSSRELMDQGIKGRDLGIKIKELEIEKFKQML
jgi:tRNA nucleotidyltransferase/poly(A) polymerase